MDNIRIDHHHFENCLRAMPIKESYSKVDLLIPEMKLLQEQSIEMYYSPHNNYVNEYAKVLIVGITPGWQQMELACRTAIHAMHNGESYSEACKAAKHAARFAGAMRANLISMLDEIGLAERLSLADASRLFDSDHGLLHTTSLIAYPVFVNEENYNGHSPSLIKNDLLYQAAISTFLPQLERLKNPILIPLGKSVELFLTLLIEKQHIAENNVLRGLPHPSGANGHRKKQFERGKVELKERVTKLNL